MNGGDDEQRPAGEARLRAAIEDMGNNLSELPSELDALRVALLARLDEIERSLDRTKAGLHQQAERTKSPDIMPPPDAEGEP
jgi:hypothetical protein